MPEPFNMPKLGLTMESGKILKWLVDDGVEVTAGQPVLLIETDKVESEVESPASGVLHRAGSDGDEFECGATIGWYLADGEAMPAGPASTAAAPATAAASVVAPTPAPTTSAPTAATARPTGIAKRGDGGRLLVSPNARRLAADRGINLAGLVGTGPGGRIVSEDLAGVASGSAARPGLAPAGVSSPSGATPPPATAAARQLADLLGVDLREVAPTGADPRLSRNDVAHFIRAILAERAAEHASAATPKPTQAPVFAPLEQTPSSVIPLTGMRGAIAERMATSLREAAQLTLTMDVDMDAVIGERKRRKAASDPVPGITDYVIAATAQALVEHPQLNSQITSDGIALLPDVHVGMAVALDDGLIVPVVRNTAALAIESLAAETTRLATAARDRKLSVDEIRGGTFSVTALGMFDVDGFTPIINPPNTAILGVGRLRKDVAWADDGAPIPVSRLTLSLTWDHRAVDGAPAAEFVRTIKRHLEDR